ncbi:MAG: hypothetical protein ACR2H3_02730, partial [Acidimicrobiales bacterium]
GGVRLAVAMGAVLALLTRGFGIETMVEPWNPYVPLLWWLVTLLAVWSVVRDDLAMLPVAVMAGSIAAQTHVPYLGLVLGMGALAAGRIGLRVWRERRNRGEIARWTLGSLALGLLLWTPVLLDQLTRSPGNLSMLRDHFLDPPESPVGLGTGLRLTALHLDVWRFVAGARGATGSLVSASSDPEGSIVPGLVVVALFVASGIVAWRLAHRNLIMLHGVAAVGLALVAYSLSRIFGKLWYYLMLSAWTVSALVLMAVTWTAFEAIRRRAAPQTARRMTTSVVGLLAATTIVSSLLYAGTARHVEPPAPRLSITLANVVPDTVNALLAEVGAATGASGRYLITWSDAFYIGSQGYGLVSELEREGFTVGVPEPWRVPVTPQRVMTATQATARVHYATGGFIRAWRLRPDAIEVAAYDPRSPAEVREFDRLRGDVIDDLLAAGLTDVIDLVDGNLFGATLDPRLPEGTRKDMERMLYLGLPGAVFITAADSP